MYYNNSHCHDPTAGQALGKIRRQEKLKHKRLRDTTWNDYGISKYRYRELKNFCLQYPEKKAKIKYGLTASGDDAGIRSGKVGRPTENQAISNSRYLKDCEMIEQAAIEAAPEIYPFIIASVTEDLCFEDIEYLPGAGRIHVGKTDFYGYRRLFYHFLNKKKLGTN